MIYLAKDLFFLTRALLSSSRNKPTHIFGWFIEYTMGMITATNIHEEPAAADRRMHGWATLSSWPFFSYAPPLNCPT